MRRTQSFERALAAGVVAAMVAVVLWRVLFAKVGLDTSRPEIWAMSAWISLLIGGAIGLVVRWAGRGSGVRFTALGGSLALAAALLGDLLAALPSDGAFTFGGAVRWLAHRGLGDWVLYVIAVVGGSLRASLSARAVADAAGRACSRDRATETAPAPVAPQGGVDLIRRGGANLRTAGGFLELTPDRLIFRPHGRAPADVESWDLRDFEDAAPALTLGLVPNAVLLRFKGASVKLMVHDRDGWMSAIRSAAVRRATDHSESTVPASPGP